MGALRVLELRGNGLSKVEGLLSCPRLEILDLSDNRIRRLAAEGFHGASESLKCLILERNGLRLATDTLSRDIMRGRGRNRGRDMATEASGCTTDTVHRENARYISTRFASFQAFDWLSLPSEPGRAAHSPKSNSRPSTDRKFASASQAQVAGVCLVNLFQPEAISASAICFNQQTPTHGLLGSRACTCFAL